VDQPESARNWYALRVRSKHEFVAHSDLSKKGIDSYLPIVKKWSQWKDRKKLIEVPLFSGYLFVKIDINSPEYLNTLKSKGAVNILSLEPGRPAQVPADEIQSLQILVDSGRELDIYPHIKEGTTVMVKKGLFKGAKGILSSKENYYMFSVDITLLGKSVCVKVPADDIETI
jgi:transcriptional antiterminator NusG